jgi:hypothetical protein
LHIFVPMKTDIKPYYTNLRTAYHKECVLLPSPEIQYYPAGNFIDQGVYDWKLVISLKFLFWEVGIRFSKNYDSFYKTYEPQGDEPTTYEHQATSVPEKQIGD